MEKTQTVYFRFPAGSEGAKSMKNLVEEITVCEEAADSLAAEMGVKEYYSDSTVEFGGIGVMMFARKPKSSLFKEMDVLKPGDDDKGCQMDKAYQLNVDSEDVVMTEEETEGYLGRTDVLISVQHYAWLDIKHRLTIRKAAEMCRYTLTGNREVDDKMISMQLGGKKFRIVTILTSKDRKAMEWYKALHRLPTLPLFTSNRYAGVTDEHRHPVYFFFNEAGDFFCKASAYSSFEHHPLTEEEFCSIYEEIKESAS